MSKALELAGLNPVRDVSWQTTVGQPDIVKQLGQKQIDAADITYHLAHLAQEQGFARIIASRDEFLPDSQTAMIAARNEILQSRRDVLIRFAMVHIHAARLFNTIAGNPAQHPADLQTITKYIFVKDTSVLKAVAPHWEWIAEDGVPNVTSVMAQQDHWADIFRLVERKVSQDHVFDLGIAREAARRLAAEKPFGP
jgi:NitT/TauT family transport system substrate-binding protein